jgi:NAD(P)H dehydrogenase (quinone)
VSIPDFVAHMEASGLSPRLVPHIRSVAQDYLDGIFSGTDDVVERLTGERPLTIQQLADRIIQCFGTYDFRSRAAAEPSIQSIWFE